MKKETFLNFLENPATLDSTSVDKLFDLVNDFPYCQTTRMLLTLNLFKEEHFRYDDELKSTAVHVANRRVLKSHIDTINRLQENIILPDELIEIDKPVQSEKIDSEVVVEETPVVEAIPEIKDVPQTETDEQKSEKTIDDLKLIVKQRIEQIEREKQQPKEPQIEKQPESVKSVNELIDEFIINEPRISRPQAAFFNPVDAARESIVDEENIVSETLAKIYFDQRRFEKAINIYRKLSLKFPEKSSYFAALIEKAVEELKK